MSSFWPGLAKGGQIGGDQHYGGVLQAGVDVRGELQAEARGDRLHRLDGIFEIVVARAGQPHDDAITRQLVRPDALEAAEILDPVGISGRRHGQRDEQGDQEATHPGNPQKGLTTEKNRLSQPWRLARATSPLPV